MDGWVGLARGFGFSRGGHAGRVRRFSVSTYDRRQEVQGFHVVLLWLSVADLFFSGSFALNFFNRAPDGDSESSIISGNSSNSSSAAAGGVVTASASSSMTTATVPCEVQAALIAFFGCASFLWTTALAMECYRTVVLDHMLTGRRLLTYHICCWGVSGGALVALAATSNLGPTSDDGKFVWCWVPDPVWRLATFYAPLTLACVVCTGLYVRVILHIRSVLLKNAAYRRYSSSGAGSSAGGGGGGGRRWQVLRSTYKLMLYPLVFVLTWLPGLVHRILNAADVHDVPAWIFFLHAFCGSSQGLFDAVVYGTTNTRVRQWWKELICCDESDTGIAGFCYYCCCCCCCCCYARRGLSRPYLGFDPRTGTSSRSGGGGLEIRAAPPAVPAPGPHNNYFLTTDGGGQVGGDGGEAGGSDDEDGHHYVAL